MADRMAFSPSARRALYEGFDYSAFWDDPSRRHLDELERFEVGELLPPRGRRILDAGCGFGRLTEVYADRFDELFLVDAAWSLLEEARDRWEGRGTLVAADVRALPFRAGSFDAALAIRVLHHISDPGATLRDLRLVMEPGARLVFNVSNKRNIKRMGTHLLHPSQASPFAPGIVPYGPRTFGMHPRDADRLLAQSGFRPTAWRGVGIMDKLAAHAGRFSGSVPRGRSLARALGRVRVAPSLFGAAVAQGTAADDPATESGSRLSVAAQDDPLARDPFRCPACRGPASEIPAGRRCERCGRIYPRREGILDFRL